MCQGKGLGFLAEDRPQAIVVEMHAEEAGWA